MARSKHILALLTFITFGTIIGPLSSSPPSRQALMGDKLPLNIEDQLANKKLTVFLIDCGLNQGANCEAQIDMKEFRRGWQLKSFKPKLCQKRRAPAGSCECSCEGNMVKGLCVKPIEDDAVVFRNMRSSGGILYKSSSTALGALILLGVAGAVTCKELGNLANLKLIKEPFSGGVGGSSVSLGKTAPGRDLHPQRRIDLGLTLPALLTRSTA
ncbi:hypothetical protein MUK42_01921 [Musa troglodytarum]|uniref:Uncharacterized protein n=1 Tax=Musa troglodytarum TaxID=320322 RepID=A0A9E7FCQ5_9LILI|nr:hypothetical protein MUK42_01921 [Musa troglodytarum]